MPRQYRFPRRPSLPEEGSEGRSDDPDWKKEVERAILEWQLGREKRMENVMEKKEKKMSCLTNKILNDLRQLIASWKD